MIQGYSLRRIWRAVILSLKIVFTFGKKAFILATPRHPNLGDHAQLLCTEKWIKKNYPNYKIILVPVGVASPGEPPFTNVLAAAISSNLVFWTIKLFIKSNDVVFGHSGYFMIDHHPGWMMFARMLYYCPKIKIVILPQTVNFYNPVIISKVSKLFNQNGNVTLFCRDEVSFEKAKTTFTGCKLLLYPDIVTSLIGTKSFNNKRSGVLFCMRDDLESFYSKEDIKVLMERFKNYRTDIVDTTVKTSYKELKKNKEKIINELIAYFSTFKVVVTDRYHGTIFAAIAATPVVVIASSDHKLSSGVNWFPKDFFGDYVMYASGLEEAYLETYKTLNKTDLTYTLKPYFKERYYDCLKSKLG